MKKIFLCLVTLIGISQLSAQSVKNTFGIGFQSSFPIYGLSAKYAISEQSVVQATIAPFGSGDFKLNFYGGRYIHRFKSDEALNPYLFAGAGLITFSGYGATASDNFVSYSAGGGVEYIVAGALGLSADLGYGKFGVSQGEGISGIFLGVGIHYYFK